MREVNYPADALRFKLEYACILYKHIDYTPYSHIQNLQKRLGVILKLCLIILKLCLIITCSTF